MDNRNSKKDTREIVTPNLQSEVNSNLESAINPPANNPEISFDRDLSHIPPPIHKEFG